jgi:hypothetical protein
MLPYTEVKVGDDIIRVELESIPIRGEVEAARVEEITEQAQDAFNQAMKAARVSAERFVRMFKHLSEKPSKVEVEFGLKLDAEAGAVVAKASTGAHYKVTLCWESDKTGDEAKS